jgi:transcriptional regulator with XRE-family HTH domain
MSKDKRPLEDWELAECAALKALIKEENASRPKEKRITQEAAGAALGMNQGSFSNYLNGRLRLNKDVAVGIFKLFGIPAEKYSKRLADEIADVAQAYGDGDYHPQNGCRRDGGQDARHDGRASYQAKAGNGSFDASE